MIRLADSHAHLNFPDFQPDLDLVMQRASAAGVEYINSIATRLTDVAALLELVQAYPQVFTAVGIHPHYAAESQDASVATIMAHCHHPRTVAVGETGFDFHYEFSPREQQEVVFRNHIRAARELGLPLIIHSREAEEATQQVVAQERASMCGGVLHCFTGTESMARWAIEQGFYLSFSGVLTFRKALELQKIAQWVPLDRLLIETDAPYLAPVPHRGKRNEPALVRHVAETLATLLDRSLEEVAHITTENYCRLFRVGSVAQQPLEAAQEKLAYVIGNGLYLNITKACTLHCQFCPKWTSKPVVHGYDLTLRRHPSASEVLAAMGDFSSYQEIVFCGFGEPTLRLETLLEVASEIKKKGLFRIRINTDGLANRVYGMDVTPRMRGLIDAVSVSLSAQDEATYNRICQPALSGSYASMLAFVRAVKEHVPEVTVTAIQGVQGVDIEAC
ncbi:MAG: YchF/TatD family DNA exonuclease, partial [Magnetococcales bacterium]|nr:YchF/TatD family DNA exonuclease [Magnetococcales bacterium]